MSAAPEDGRKVVLFVEDDLDDTHLTLRALAGVLEPFRVVTARDGVEALAYLERPGAPEGLALVVLDINLPRVSGFELLERLYALWGPGLRGVRFAVLSASYADSEIRRMKELGVALHIQKPISRAQTEEMVRELGRLL